MRSEFIFYLPMYLIVSLTNHWFMLKIFFLTALSNFTLRRKIKTKITHQKIDIFKKSTSEIVDENMSFRIHIIKIPEKFLHRDKKPKSTPRRHFLIFKFKFLKP